MPTFEFSLNGVRPSAPSESHSPLCWGLSGPPSVFICIHHPDILPGSRSISQFYDRGWRLSSQESRMMCTYRSTRLRLCSSSSRPRFTSAGRLPFDHYAVRSASDELRSCGESLPFASGWKTNTGSHFRNASPRGHGLPVISIRLIALSAGGRVGGLSFRPSPTL